MAAGAVTETDTTRNLEKIIKYGTVELPSSYAAGGVALGTALFGLSVVDFVQFEPILLDATHIVVPFYNRSTDKIMVFESGDVNVGPVEITNGDDLHLLTLRYRVEGKL